MKLVELRGKPLDELKGLLKQFKKEAFNLRFQKSSGELENTARIRGVRRTIARILTLINSLAKDKKGVKVKKRAKGASHA